MFLTLLQNTEKEAFLDVAISLALVDEKFEKEEKEFLQIYCNEMNLPFPCIEKKIDLNSVLENVNKTSSKQSKKIFLIELLGLANADGNFADEEKEFIKKLCAKLELSKNEFDEAFSLLETYRQSVTSIVNFINL